MVRSEGFLVDRKGSFVEWFSVFVMSLISVQPSKVVEARRINLMSFAKFFFGQFDECLGIGNSLSVFRLFFE